MFDEPRPHDIVKDEDGKEWRQFQLKSESIKHDDQWRDEMPDFEETMLVDTIRAIRNDAKA